MKRILLILFLIAIPLSGCNTTNPIVCGEGERLEGEKCVTIEIVCETGTEKIDGECKPIECDIDEVLNGNTCETIVCEDVNQHLVEGVCEIITCSDNQQLNEGVCETIPEIDTAFSNLEGMDNYKMTVELTEGDVSVTLELFFDENKSMYSSNGEYEYYVNESGTCTVIYEELGFIKTEEYPCVDAENNAYQFFYGFQKEWFIEEDGVYKLDEGRYSLLTNFFRQSISTAIVENFILDIDDGYFHTFTFDVIGVDATYQFVITFSMIDEVNINLPN